MRRLLDGAPLLTSWVAGTRPRPGSGLRTLFEPRDDVLGQDAHDQVAALLELRVLAAVAAIGVGVLEMVIAVDLDRQSRRRGRSTSIAASGPNGNRAGLSGTGRRSAGSDSSRSNRNRSAALRDRPFRGRTIPDGGFVNRGSRLVKEREQPGRGTPSPWPDEPLLGPGSNRCCRKSLARSLAAGSTRLLRHDCDNRLSHQGLGPRLPMTSWRHSQPVMLDQQAQRQPRLSDRQIGQEARGLLDPGGRRVLVRICRRVQNQNRLTIRGQQFTQSHEDPQPG